MYPSLDQRTTAAAVGRSVTQRHYTCSSSIHRYDVFFSGLASSGVAGALDMTIFVYSPFRPCMHVVKAAPVVHLTTATSWFWTQH